MNESLFELLVRLFGHLSQRRKRQMGLLMGLMVISAFAEVVSLGLVLPFLGVLISPEKIFSTQLGKSFTQTLDLSSPDQLVLFLTVTFVTASIVAGGIRLLQLWASTRLTFATGADLSIEVYRRTLYQPYHKHLSRNSSEVVSSIIDKVNHVAFWVLLPLLTLFSSIVMFLAVTIALIVINPLVASVSIVGFGVSYGLITWVSRSRLMQNSKLIAHKQTQVIKALQEGLGGIRDVLLDGTQATYCDIYQKADQPLRYAYGSNIFISGSPRFAMESLGMALIAALAYGLSRQVGGIGLALPTLGALAIGAQRVLPALQQAYSAWSSIVGSQATLGFVIDILDQSIQEDLLLPTPNPLPFKENIQFKNIRFRYTSDGPWILDNLNFEIPKGSRVGFVGVTGSGKSTTLDLLMGLLEPTEGEILVDGMPIKNARLRAWQRSIAHVPQAIYLADASITENIAFGVPPDSIDMERVKKAAYQARITDFIESRPKGYDAFVGERGIRLSGGQRQRIGIARALYKQSTIFVFDEATSALDTDTEQGVMDAIEALSRDFTILIIAHRLSTLERCDFIIELENGRVKA